MAVDMFLKLDGVDGESLDHKHKGEIEILSFSWGLTNSIGSATGGGGAGKVKFNEFTIVKMIDSASPKFMERCCQGEHISNGQLTLVARGQKGNQEEFLKIKLTDILVSSYQTGGSNQGGIVPMDQVTLNFASVDVTALNNRGQATSISCDVQKVNTDGNLGGGHHHD